MGHDVDSYRKSHLQRNHGGKHVCSVQREARKTMFLEQCEGDVRRCGQKGNVFIFI